MSKPRFNAPISGIGAKTSQLINKTRLLLGLAAVLTFGSCDKPNVDPINPSSTQGTNNNSNNGNNTVPETTDHAARVEKYKAEFEANRVKYDSRYDLYPGSFWANYFELGIGGYAQYKKMISSNINNIDPNKEVVLIIADHGHQSIDGFFAGKYEKLLTSGVVVLRGCVGGGALISDSWVQKTTKIFDVPGYAYNSNHGRYVRDALFGVGGIASLDDLLILAEKYPNGNSPFKIIFEGSIQSGFQGELLDESIKLIRSAKYFNRHHGSVGIFSSARAPYFDDEGKPRIFLDSEAKNLLQINSNPNVDINLIRQYNNTLELNALKAAVEYNKMPEHIIVGALLYEGKRAPITNPIQWINYGEYNTGTTTTGYGNVISDLSPSSDKMIAGTSTVNTITSYFAAMDMLFGKGVNVQNYKKLLKEQLLVSSDDNGMNPPKNINPVRNLLISQGLLPVLTTCGPDGDYLLSDKYDIIDPNKKFETYVKDGKTYLRKSDAAKLVGQRYNFDAVISYNGMKLFIQYPTDIVASGTTAFIKSQNIQY